MKILVVSQYYWPEHFQITDECEELVARGHEVTVLTGLPNYPSGTIAEGYRRGLNRSQVRGGVEIKRVPLVARGSSPIRLGLNYHSFSWFAKRAVRSLAPDFDVVYVPEISPVTMIEPGALYKELYGAPLFVYCMDLWPESLKNVLGSRLPSVVRRYEGISRRLYKAADVLAVQSPAFVEYLRDLHGVDESKMVYLPQFADSGYLDGDFNEAHEGVNFLVMGNMGRAQDIPVLLEAVDMMGARSGFAVHFVGSGSCFEQTENEIRRRGLGDRVVLHGARPYGEMASFYAVADACLLALNGDTWIGTTIPSRLQGYMAAGKPVFAAANGGAASVIKESACGNAVRAGDSAGLARLMDDFVSNPESYRDCGSRARSYFSKNFKKEIHMDRLEGILLRLAERKTGE